jgi:hypothetical protein
MIVAVAKTSGSMFEFIQTREASIEIDYFTLAKELEQRLHYQVFLFPNGLCLDFDMMWEEASWSRDFWKEVYSRVFNEYTLGILYDYSNDEERLSLLASICYS